MASLQQSSVKLVTCIKNEHYAYDLTIPKEHNSKTPDELSAALTLIAFPSMIAMNIHKVTMMYILSRKLRQCVCASERMKLWKQLNSLIIITTHHRDNIAKFHLLHKLAHHDYCNPHKYSVVYIAEILMYVLEINTLEFYVSLANIFGLSEFDIYSLNQFAEDLRMIKHPLIDEAFIHTSLQELYGMYANC